MITKKTRDPRAFIILVLLSGIFLGGRYLQTNRLVMVRAHVYPDNGIIRVIAFDQERVFSTLSPYGRGFERDLLESFARGANYHIQWLSAGSQEEALEALAAGRADIYIGQGAQGARHDPRIMAGPAYAHYRPLLIQAQPGEESVAAANHVLMPATLASQTTSHGQVPFLRQASLTRVPQRIGFSTVLNSLHARTAPMAVVADARFRLWQPFYLGLRPTGTLPEIITWRWFWRTDDKRLAAVLTSFWHYHETETQLAELTERYFGFFPAKTPYYELEFLYETIENALPVYAPHIAEQTARHGIDPLLFTALIYQESRFDPKAKSHTGAKGLLQFTRIAAKHFELENRYDPVASIRAGCEYLRLLHENLEDLDLTPWNRWFFALAAYNQGMGHLRDAISLARSMGMSGRTWHELKSVFPLLEEPRYAENAPHGSCRGREAVTFVDSVRYYLYILNGIVRLSRPEAQHLGPLLHDLAGGSIARGDGAPLRRPLS